MPKSMRRYLAFDIGASNGRCIMGEYDGQTLSLEIVNRFDNGYVRVRDHLYWGILALFNSVKSSLAKAALEVGRDSFASIGVDTWATDFGLLDEKGDLIGNPYCYRDPHTAGMMDEVFKLVPKEEVFQVTGIQLMPINTLYHLMAMTRAKSPALEIARTYLMVPDLINYWLTGQKMVEFTNASVTQIMDVREKNWAYPMLKTLGIPDHIFPEIVQAGQVLAPLQKVIQDETGLSGTPVVAVGTHDTASAVASVPATVSNFAYLSSGTWGLLGTELPGPNLDPKVMEYNFGNEGGVFNTIRLLRNVVNMWLVQECTRIWQLQGTTVSWDEMIQLATEARPFMAFIDPDHPDFLVPDDMPQAIRDYCQRTGQQLPESKGELVRVCLESLAMKYRYNMEKLADIIGQQPEVFHIVGGASRNHLLNQFAANVMKQPVVAGPSEATALGNLVVQLIATGDLAGMEEGRQLIAQSFPTEPFEPTDTSAWDEQYAVFLEKTGLPPIPA